MIVISDFYREPKQKLPKLTRALLRNSALYDGLGVGATSVFKLLITVMRDAFILSDNSVNG